MTVLAFLHPCQRTQLYRQRARETHAERDPEHALRQRAGLDRQARMHLLPLPGRSIPILPHKALVIAGPLIQHERHPIPS